MNIPKNLKVGGMVYEVDKTPVTIVLDTKQCSGMIDYDYHKIKIDTSIQDEQGMEQTLLHEMFHAIHEDKNISFKDEDEEAIIDKLAQGLYQVIKDNPQMFNSKQDKKTRRAAK